MTGAPWRENCHLVIDRPSGDAILVDPGDRASILLAAARGEGATIRHVALTHGHHDHVGAVTEVCRQLALPCLVHQRDIRLTRQAPLWAFRFAGRKIATPAPLETLTPDCLSIGAQAIRILETPGHTEGGVCYLVDGLAITGDTLLFKHVGRTDLPGSNQSQLRDSVTALLRELSDDVVLFAGHGREWTSGEARVWWSRVGEVPQSLDEHRDLS
jgi:glyoxylase-like metal-dependent hydrolase (beta-lactamase superfamily II)